MKPKVFANMCVRTPGAGCQKTFYNVHGCKVHADKCRWRDVFIVERILKVKGVTGSAIGGS